MTSKLMPRNLAPLPTDRSRAADRDGHASAQAPDLPDARSAGGGLAIGLLLTILFFGIPLLLYCVLTSG